jgi:hypothetical protein
MLVYAVVSEETEKAVGLFVRREQAERFLENVAHGRAGASGPASDRGGRPQRRRSAGDERVDHRDARHSGSKDSTRPTCRSWGTP